MELHKIAEFLDNYFRVHEFQPDQPFSQLVPEVYGEAAISFEEYLEPRFLKSYHGLMIRNGTSVEKIYSIVFPADEIIEELLKKEKQNVLIITHHPLMMETSDRGFVPLPEDLLRGMKDQHISMYAVHTPLDVHPHVSTTIALGREIGVMKRADCCFDSGGPTGIWGNLLSEVDLKAFIDHVSAVSGVKDTRFVDNGRMVRTVGVRPGGVGVPEIMEFQELGCDTVVTGTYNNLVKTEIGQWYRDQFKRAKNNITVNLIECSHYATEAFVMKLDMVKLCSQFDVPCSFLPQDDPWL